MMYGYARVSTKEQNLDRQIVAIQKMGVSKINIITDKQSGTNFNRNGYKKLMRKMKPRDTLYIKSIDRLGRNYNEIITQWQYITETKNVDIVVIDFPLLDTRAVHEGITGKFIADITLQILSYVSQVERENIRQRQKEGIQIAKEKGVVFGRKSLEIPKNFEELYKSYKSGQISSLRKIAKIIGVSHTTVAKWVKMSKKQIIL